MTETEATSLLSTENDQGVLPLAFETSTEYTTFTSEHAFDGDDIVFHFFTPPGLGDSKEAHTYWLETFPDVLSEVAQEVFQAEYPRLRAAWTAEHASWWMRASGFAAIGIPEERVQVFFAKLDQSLEARNVKNRPV